MSEPDPRKALEDIVFLALQRPAMFWGCPSEGVMLNLCGSILAGAWLGNGLMPIAYWIVFIPTIHLIMRAGVSRDYNWFRIKKLGIDTKGYGTAIWGGSTVTPIPDVMPSKARDLPVAL
jgi:type IV secretory pathway VirB3-like protein